MRFLAFISFAWVLFAGAAFAQVDRRTVAVLAQGMEAVRAKDWAALGTPRDPVAAAILDWHRLRASEGDYREYPAFVERYKDWPGLPLLLQRGEKTIPADAPSDAVLRYFGAQLPRTGTGALRLATALRAHGKGAEADGQIVLAWRGFLLTRAEEAQFLEDYASLLQPHHAERVNMLLWRARGRAAERLYPLISADLVALSKARIGLRRKVEDVNGLIDAVPQGLQGHPGLAYERFLWRASKGLDVRAGTLIVAESRKAALAKPELWSNRRRSLARQLMRAGNTDLAYQVATTHRLSAGSDYADLEWLAGFIALRKQNAPDRALIHFERFLDAVKSPISLGRAGYWIGRAYEAKGDAPRAKVAWQAAAEFETSFYGQLAAEKLGLRASEEVIGARPYGDWRQAPFAGSSVLKAALLLQKAGELSLTERFLVHLAETQSAEGLGQLAELALGLDEPHVALMIAKQAASMGVVLPRAYYPVSRLGTFDSPVPAPLALAIARRESEFDPEVVSPAGAKGLMQVMPKTAAAVAGRLGLPYEEARLTQDWRYNATLGTRYLAEMTERFEGNMALVSAAYNAGPSRPERWIGLFGDPRDTSVDPVDWVETIPFRETRNYVMRVLESLPVYEARTTGRAVPYAPTKLLRQTR